MDDNSLEVRREQMERMYQEYKHPIYRYIRRNARCDESQAEDLTEEVFARTWRHLEGGGKPIESPEKWLKTVAKRICIRFTQNPGKFETISAGSCISLEGEGNFPYIEIADNDRNNQPEQAVEYIDRLKRLHTIIADLPLPQQRAVVLHYINDQTFEEISKQLGVSSRTASRYAHAGINQMRVRLLRMEE
jgi:RNA polymerase sigma factor (sigma-70 family)